MKKNKKTFLNKDQEIEKLEGIIGEMRSINKLITITKEDDKRFDELIDQIIEIDPKFINQYLTLLKFCVVYLDNFHSRRNKIFTEDFLNSVKNMLDSSIERSNEVSELQSTVLEQYDRIISYIKFSNNLSIERDDLFKIAYESKVFYKPFVKEFNKIHLEKSRTKDELNFAFSILEEVKTKKSSFLILIYRNKEYEHFLRVFPKIRNFDFSKLNSRYGNKEFVSVLDEYFIKFCDALKPSKKSAKKKEPSYKK